MRILLNATRPWTLFTFTALLLSVSGTLAFNAGKLWLSEMWSGTFNPRLWSRAAQLEPSNAETWDQLGQYALLTSGQNNVSQALAYLERAANLNPRSDRIWLDLAAAYEAAEDMNRARHAYAKAQEDYPLSAKVAWRYGSFLIRQRDYPAGFAEIRRAIAGDPALTTAAVSECWEASPKVNVIVKQLLPQKRRYYWAALNFFLSQQNWDAALGIWKGLLNLGRPIKMEASLPLIDSLIAANRPADAQSTWTQALAAARWPQSPPRRGDLIFSGGFEHSPVNGGFDWREESLPGVSYAMDRTTAHSGKQSIRINFDGSANLDFAGLIEYVAVEPHKKYRFTAYQRTRDGGFPDRRFDIEFWQEQGDEVIFRAAWEMVRMIEEFRHGRQPRFQRTVTRVERKAS